MSTQIPRVATWVLDQHGKNKEKDTFKSLYVAPSSSNHREIEVRRRGEWRHSGDTHKEVEK